MTANLKGKKVVLDILDQMSIYFAGGQNGAICQLLEIESYIIRDPALTVVNFTLPLGNRSRPSLVFASKPSVAHDTGINKSWRRKLQNYIWQTLGNNYCPAGSGAESRN